MKHFLSSPMFGLLLMLAPVVASIMGYENSPHQWQYMLFFAGAIVFVSNIINSGHSNTRGNNRSSSSSDSSFFTDFGGGDGGDCGV